MMIHGKQFCTNPIGEYETMNSCTPYRLIDLKLNQIFGQGNGKFYKTGWVPVIYFVGTRGTIFNWDDIVSHRLFACISATLGGTSQKKSKFYMSYLLVDFILCTHQFPTLNYK